jgi:hypothetical protein
MTTKTLGRNRISDNGDAGSESELLNGSMAVAEAQAATNAKEKAKGKRETITVAPLRLKILEVVILGSAPYMQLRFSQKAIAKMRATQEAGGQAKSKKNREARNFEDDYLNAFHRFPNGTPGIPASSIRAACISACRTCGFKMTLAKLSIFTLADGLDVVDGVPLIKIFGTPEMSVQPVRNASGVTDLRSRPVWREWHATVRIRFDEDQFSAGDAYNLLSRAGAQVGIGEGRPDSRESAGIGFGTFEVLLPDDAAKDERVQRIKTPTTFELPESGK